MARVSPLLLLLLACQEAAAPEAGATAASRADSWAPSSWEAAPEHALVVEVAGVSDGDTLRVRGVPGTTGTERVRLIGIDCPEVAHSAGERAEALAERASARLAALAGTQVQLVFDVEERDRYGRLLAYVHPADGETMINATLVREGLAWAVSFPPNVRHADAFRDLSREARESDRGVWGLSEGALPARLARRLARER